MPKLARNIDSQFCGAACAVAFESKTNGAALEPCAAPDAFRSPHSLWTREANSPAMPCFC